jgi:hypothetical protein
MFVCLYHTIYEFRSLFAEEYPDFGFWGNICRKKVRALVHLEGLQVSCSLDGGEQLARVLRIVPHFCTLSVPPRPPL